jgi:SNF2 family DNA or RNA helicase
MHRILEAYTGRVCREATARRESGGRLASIVLRKRALSSAGSLAISVRRRIGLLDLQGPAAVQALLPLDEEDTADDRVPDHLLGAPGLADRRTELALLRAVEAAADEAARDETKMRALAAFLRRLHEPAIVFTEYRDTLDRLHAWLTGSGIPACLLHGGLTLAERRRAVALFERGGRTLLATDAASEGLNLHQTCRLVIHYELPWTPSRLEQRAGRVDRHGQLRRVHEVALVAADTAEAMVLGPLARRIANRRAGSHHLLDNLAE